MPLRSRKTFVLVVLVLLFIVVGAVSYVGWRQSVRPPSVTSAAPRMLGHKTTDQVSRYEKGERLPGLKLLLLLEIIYGVPPRVLVIHSSLNWSCHDSLLPRR